MNRSVSLPVIVALLALTVHLPNPLVALCVHINAHSVQPATPGPAAGPAVARLVAAARIRPRQSKAPAFG